MPLFVAVGGLVFAGAVSGVESSFGGLVWGLVRVLVGLLGLLVVPAGVALVLWSRRPAAAHWVATLLGALAVALGAPGMPFEGDRVVTLAGLALVAAAFPLGEAPRRLAR